MPSMFKLKEAAAPTSSTNSQQNKMAKRVFFIAHGGEVQGVGFRYFAQRRATAYNLTGWCRNAPDNKVEGEAQGDDDAVDKFLHDVGKGPRQAEVAKLHKEERDVVEDEQSFEIRH